MRYAYPTKESMQVIGTLLGGLLPMNLYMSQSLGNEPLAGMLTAAIVLSAFKLFSAVSQPTRESGLIMGFLLGLALLTKVTALLIVFPVALFVFRAIVRKSGSRAESIRLSFRFGVTFIGLAVIVSGWYYLHNWFAMGRFFVGGWDVYREIVWWQDPGYGRCTSALPLESLCFIRYSLP
jgi:4-amino-4-deoxy-L-arabinose transferase-like glycosyltransferase